jgi:mannose-6-phosphate isomerase-like protein (cupin superfamily)
MDPRFTDIENLPENEIFSIVAKPEWIYHARYLNATRSSRYRYYVQEVRSKLDNLVMKGQVFLDGGLLGNFVRIEYRASRLVEQAREMDRFLTDSILAYVKLVPKDSANSAKGMVRLHWDAWVDAYQVEIWETLEPPRTKQHDIKVLDQMGREGAITRIRQFTPILADIDILKQVELAFCECEIEKPFGYRITNPQMDTDYRRSYQVPKSPMPDARENRVKVDSYLFDFQRGFFFPKVRHISPVRYKNPMIEQSTADYVAADSKNNIIEIRWVVQRELGGSLVYFHEVTIPPGAVEGAHRQIGSEELLYVIEGEGVAYLGDGDDPQLTDSKYPVRNVHIFWIGKRDVREVRVQPGSVIYTKSGGIHGVHNCGHQPLRMVAFGYHSE